MIEQTSVALLTAMDTQRDTVNVRIRQGLRHSATEYPLGVALADVYAYFRAGTILGGLKGVSRAVGAQREEVDRLLQQPVVGHQSPPPAFGGIGALPPAGVPSGVGPTPATPASPPSVPNRPAFTAAITGLQFEKDGRTLTPGSLELVQTCAARFGIPKMPVAEISRNAGTNLNAITDCIIKQR